MISRTLSAVFGVVFIGLGLLGFSKNPVIGSTINPLFYADKVHNMVHIGLGILCFVFAGIASRTVLFLKVFGIIYFLLGLLGVLSFGAVGEGDLFGFLHVNGADNILHMALGALIFLAGIAETVIPKPEKKEGE